MCYNWLMWNVGEKNIISVGRSLPSIKFLRAYDQTLNILEAHCLEDLFNNFPVFKNEIDVIVYEFTEWNFETIQIYNFFKNRKTILIFIFENQDEFNLNFNQNNSCHHFSIIKDDLFIDNTLKLLSLKGYINVENEFATAKLLNLKTEVLIPLFLKSIDKDQLTIEAPQFSEEIIKQDYFLDLNALQEKIDSTNSELNISNEKIVRNNFEEVIAEMTNFSFCSTPYVNVALFAKQIDSSFFELYSKPNTSISVYDDWSDNIPFTNFDIVFIEEKYIDNDPFSKKIIERLEKNNEIIVLFNAKSTSRAYQKVFNYGKIILNRVKFSDIIVSELIDIYQNQTKDGLLSFNQFDTLGSGLLETKGEIISINESQYHLKLPFELQISSNLKTAFWNEFTGEVVKVEKDKNEYLHVIKFNNLTEINENEIRVLVNKIIQYQNESREPLLLENMNSPLVIMKKAG